VEHGADINKTCSKGFSSLFNACLTGNVELVSYLVKHGADINKESIHGTTPLFMLVQVKMNI